MCGVSGCGNSWVNSLNRMGIDWLQRNAVSEWSGYGCDFSSSGLGKYIRYEIGEPYFIGCVPVCVQNLLEKM